LPFLQSISCEKNGGVIKKSPGLSGKTNNNKAKTKAKQKQNNNNNKNNNYHFSGRGCNYTEPRALTHGFCRCCLGLSAFARSCSGTKSNPPSQSSHQLCDGASGSWQNPEVVATPSQSSPSTSSARRSPSASTSALHLPYQFASFLRPCDRTRWHHIRKVMDLRVVQDSQD